MFRHQGRRKAALPRRTLAAQLLAGVLAAAVHTAQPAMDRQRLGTGDLLMMALRHLRARLEVEVEATHRRRRRPPKT